MSTTRPVTFPPKRLAEEITASDMTFKLSDIVGWDGVNDITSASFGSVHYITFRDDANTRIEIMQIDPSTIASYATGIAINLRGLAYVGTSLVESSARKFAWPKNETIVELGTNAPQLLADMLSLGRDQTVTGIITFTNTAAPRASAAVTYGAGTEEYFATKRYVDGVALAGAPDASTTQKGVVEKATSAELAAGTATGGTGAPLFVSPDVLQPVLQAAASTYVVEDGTGADDAYTGTCTPTLTAYTAGQLFRVKLTVANTGAATLNLDSLGVKNVKKYVAGAIADLETGDIVANQHVILVYDGTQFVLQTPSATTMTTALQSEAASFFGATDITGSEAETLTGGSNAESLHYHLWYPVASDTIRASADTERSTSSSTYSKFKETKLYTAASKAGTARIKFDIKTASPGNLAYGRIYINGVAAGTERSDTTGSYTTFSEDLAVTPGDLIQLYLKNDGSAAACYGRNFRVYFTKTELTSPVEVITD